MENKLIEATVSRGLAGGLETAADQLEAMCVLAPQFGMTPAQVIDESIETWRREAKRLVAEAEALEGPVSP